MKRYFFRDNSPYKDDDAQEIGEFLESQFPDSKIKPEKVVELARDTSSPIHKYFDWNDRSAAQKYRLRTAGQLVAALYVKIENIETRAYENVYIKAIDERHYVATDEICQSEDLYKQVLESAKREILFWEAKYSLYKNHLPKIFSAISELKKEQAHGESQKGRKRARRATDRNSTNRGKNSRNKTGRNDAAAG